MQFYHGIKSTNDAIVISGDIAEASSIEKILKEMAEHTGNAIYYVLGNHDYYGGNVIDVRESMRSLTNNYPLLFWLGACEPILLENNTILLGEDGWADGRYGDYANSSVSLNDSRMIQELFQQKKLGKFQLLNKMQQLADDDAHNLYKKLNIAATKDPKKIIVLTHVPPFRETSMYEGKISGDDFLPFFSSKATGDVLLKFAKEHPLIDILVLCGHTHHSAEYKPLNNLTIKVGKAEYNQPMIQGMIDTPTLALN
jgi:predicted phosphohydrolase